MSEVGKKNECNMCCKLFERTTKSKAFVRTSIRKITVVSEALG